jgi:ubiquinone/menaquinone biosynthesis C-methylase UbiE
MEDKSIEQERYNKLSTNFLNTIEKEKDLLLALGTDNTPLYLQPPYIYYHDLIFNKTSKSKTQLDLCCGNGVHSFTGAKNGAKVVAIDYAEQSIMICKKRSEKLKLNVDFKVGDVQNLKDYNSEEFDIVTCAGSLSYLDNVLFFNEVYRVLKPGGTFICVDSFNHNPIYRFNRFIHYLRGNRTYMTLKRMPNKNTIKLLKHIFLNVEVKYFGVFSFMAPLLMLFISSNRTANLISKLDLFFPFLKNYSFKIVFCASK